MRYSPQVIVISFVNRNYINKKYFSFPEDKSVKDASNYCRNPDKDSNGPWCFVTHSTVSWAYCKLDVDFCCEYQFLSTLSMYLTYLDST